VAKKIVPDQQSFENVERDYPNEADSNKSLLAQADMLLREHGYVCQSDGTYEKPRQLIRSRVTCHAGSLRLPTVKQYQEMGYERLHKELKWLVDHSKRDMIWLNKERQMRMLPALMAMKVLVTAPGCRFPTPGLPTGRMSAVCWA
jgi:hypothetical protein